MILDSDVMNAPTSRGVGRPEFASYASPGCACPGCNGATTRIPRRLVDLLASMFITVSRYRCDSRACNWEGNLRVKRRALLLQDPW